MPRKPSWYSRLDEILEELGSSSRSFVDRPTLESLLRVGRRRAQQILAPCITDRVGTNGLADRTALIARLRQIAEGEDAFYELQRRRKLAHILVQSRRERLERPQLLIEAPNTVINQELQDLPPGIQLSPGRITVEFKDPQQALQQLLALAMAIGNDLERFERLTEFPHSPPSRV